MEQIQVLPNTDKNAVSCPRCQSSNYKKLGTRRGKQRYNCKDCNRYFTENIINSSVPI